MKEVVSQEEILSSIRQIRAISSKPITNFFYNPNKIAAWISKRKLYLVQNCFNGSTLFVHEDRGFYHLYFIADSEASLQHSLLKITNSWRGILVTDLIGRKIEVNKLSSVFCSNGFKHLKLLVRLSKLAEYQNDNLTQFSFVERATIKDTPMIMAALENNFNIFTEQLPFIDEISEAAREGRILLVRKAERIAGLLYFEVNGLSSILRYWLVDPLYRSEGIGSALMREYFRSCPQVKRFILWVLEDNENAIKKYAHYGYHPEELFDQVLIFKGDNV